MMTNWLRQKLAFARYALRYAVRLPFFRFMSTESVFASIYRDNVWGSSESVSGRGSTNKQTQSVAARLPALVRELGARSFLDLPCGDFYWMHDVDLGVERYLGADIVDELVERNRREFGREGREFVKLDLIRDPLPRSDIIFCRDCLVHLPLADGRAAIRNFKRSGSTYLLATTFTACQKNWDMVMGGWRPLNLELPPFTLPKPMQVISEACSDWGGRAEDKSMALWRLADLADY